MRCSAARFLGVAAFALACAAFVAGCGGGEDQNKDKKGSAGDVDREAKVARDRQQELGLKKKVDSLKMPEELAKEWFYDGDGTLDIGVQWRADGGKLRLAVGPATGPGRTKAIGGTGFKQIVGFYVGDSARGPYKYLGRVLGSELILPDPVKLKEVKDRWYRAVAYNDAGQPANWTAPVQVEIVDIPVKTAAAPKKPEPAKKTADAKKGDASAKTDAKAEEPAPVAKPVIVVVPLANATERDKLERQYFGRGMGEVLREFLAASSAVVEVDPDYADSLWSRQRAKGAMTQAALAEIGKAARADGVITGSFEVGPDSIKLTLTYIQVAGNVVLSSKPVAAANEKSDELGKTLAGDLADLLQVTFDEASGTRLSVAWKALNERRQYIEKAIKLHDANQHIEALGAIESVKPLEVMDPQVLMMMSDTYADRGQFAKAGRLFVLTSRVPAFKPTADYYTRLTKLLVQARNLPEELDVLAGVKDPDPLPAWNAAVGLIDATLRVGGPAAADGSGPGLAAPTEWPVARFAWQVTQPGVMLDPVIADDSLLIFGSETREVIGAFGPTSNPGNRGSVHATTAAPESWDTYLYKIETGQLKWHKAKLMSGMATPVVSMGTIYGMGEKGPIAVSAENSDVLWEDRSGDCALPVVMNMASEFGKPPWRTWEMALVGPYLAVWLPRENGVHVYEAKTGRATGTAWHNATWGVGGQYFIRRGDGPYFLTRGGAELVKLDETLLGDPQKLTSEMRLVADPSAMVQSNMVIETTRVTAQADTSRFDYFVTGYDTEKREFSWLYPIMSKDPPVIVDGKLYVYKPDISGNQSTRIQRIDVNAEEASTIDCGGFEISLYEPTIALPDGNGLMVGSQAAIYPDGRKRWVNRALPVTRNVRVVGQWLFIPPFLVDPDTGKVAWQIEPPAGVRFDSCDIVATEDTIVVIKSAEVRREKEFGTDTQMWGYLLKAPAGAAPAATPLALPVSPTEPPAPVKMTPDGAMKVLMDSNVVAPADEHLTEIYGKLAAAIYQATGNPRDPSAFLVKALEARPRNPLHLVHIAGHLKPYVAMSGDYDTFTKLVETLRGDFQKNAAVNTGFAALEKEIQAEKLEVAKAREYFETVKSTADDPMEDWASAWPPSGNGNRGVSTTLARALGWTYRPVRSSENDRIMPVGPAVLVLQGGADSLLALKNDDGTKMWERPGVINAVYYRGMIYVLGAVPGGSKGEFEIRAVTPVGNQTLWHKRLDFPVTKATPLAAGLDLVFYATPDEIVAVDWATGLDVWRQTVSGRERLDVHGSVLVTTNKAGRMVALDAKKGDRLWAKDAGAYSLYDGKVYAFTATKDTGRTDLQLEVCHAVNGHEVLRRHYDLPVAPHNPPEVLPPAVTTDSIFVVSDLNLLQIGRSNGEVVAKQKLTGAVTRPITSSPSDIYLLQADRKLAAYDISTGLSPIYSLEATGNNTAVAADGSLFLINAGEIRCYRGQTEKYPPEHLKAIATPNEKEATEGVLPIDLDTRVTKARYVSLGSVRGQKDLFKKMDDKRIGDLAFVQILNLGKYEDWKTILDEVNSKLPPGERKTRPLSDEERRMLYAELIQRRDGNAPEALKEALKSGNQVLALTVLDLMTTGDRSIYGPLLLKLFKEALDAKSQMTAQFAADAVGRWRYEPAVGLLVQGLEDSKGSEPMRLSCAKALARFDKPEATRALAKTAQMDPINSLPKVSADLLATQGPDGIRALVGLMNGQTYKELVRTNAASALGQSHTPEAAAALLAAVRKSDLPPKVRGIAAGSMAGAAKDSEEVVNALDLIMEDPKADTYLRNACLHALATSDNPKAIPMVIGVMGNHDVDNSKFAGMNIYQYAQRLTKATGLGPYPEKWQEWWAKNKDRILNPQ